MGWFPSVCFLGSCVLLLLSSFSGSDALYFFLDEGAEKCFLQEMPDDTLLVANYKCSVSSIGAEDPHAKQRGVMIEIKDPHNRIVLSRPYRYQGRFSYKSHEPGKHSICMHTNTSHPFKGKIRIDFDLQVGEHAMNHSAHNRRMHLTDLESRYQQLLEKAIEINKETAYLRYREESFRGTTETISRRVLLWMVGETALLLVIGVWQVENLRRFFDAKKLV